MTTFEKDAKATLTRDYGDGAKGTIVTLLKDRGPSGLWQVTADGERKFWVEGKDLDAAPPAPPAAHAPKRGKPNKSLSEGHPQPFDEIPNDDGPLVV